ncbi:MAG: hypothetical protein NTNFB02_07290 [Nitrospira sp.]
MVENGPWAGFEPNVFTDVPLTNLSSDAQSALQNASKDWLNSFRFSAQFAFPPATNVWVRLDEHAQVSQACFYLEQTWRRWFRTLHIFGPTALTSDELRELLQARDADLATVTCMRPEDVRRWSGPWHRWSTVVVNEDIVVELPRSENEYLESLGQNARTQLPYYLRRVEKEWGAGYTTAWARGGDISLQMVSELVELNRVRIEQKGATHIWNPQLTEQRWKLAQECGLFFGLYHGDKLMAGTFSSLHRNEAYFLLIGHHRQYDRLRLGKLALWLTIQHLIREGFVRYHLLWGLSPYKLQLGGQPHALSELAVFRHSSVAAVWYLDRWMRRLLRGVRWLMKAPKAIGRRVLAPFSKPASWLRAA